MTDAASTPLSPAPGSLPPPASSAKQAPSFALRAGRAYSPTTKPVITKTIAIPLQFAALIPHALSWAAARPVVKVIGGVGYVASGLTELAFHGLRKVTDIAKNRELINASSSGTQELIRMGLSEIEGSREAKGETAQTAISWAKWGGKTLVGLLPGGGVASSAIEGVAGAVSKVEKIEREAERVNLSVARWHLGWGIERIRQLAPIALGAASWTLSQGEALSEWLKNKSYQAWTTPESVGQGLSNLADVCDAVSFKMWNMYGETSWLTSEPISLADTNQGVDPQRFGSEVKREEVESFVALDKVLKKEVLFLVADSKTFALADDKIALYKTAVQQVLEQGAEALQARDVMQALQELIGLFKNLPSAEREKLTSRVFRSLDELTKLQLLQVVREQATNLTNEDRRFILSPSFRHLHKEGDWERLSEDEKRQLEAFLIRHFNQLPGEKKRKMYSLTVEQYQRLSSDAKKTLLSQVISRVKEKGSPQEKAQIAALEKKEIVTQINQIQILLRLFSKHFTKEEKFQTYSLLHSELMLFRASSEELSEMIKEQKVKLATISEGSAEYKPIKQLILWLQEQQKLFEAEERQAKDYEPSVTSAQVAASPVSAFTASKKVTTVEATRPVDMQHVQQVIGPHVTSGLAKDIPYAVGYLPRAMMWAPGGASWLIFRALGGVCEPWIPEGLGLQTVLAPFLTKDEEGNQRLRLLEGAMYGSAKAIDMALLYPTVQKMLMDNLAARGVPAYEINQTLATFPAWALERLIAVEGHLLRQLKSGLQGADIMTGRFFTIQDNLRRIDQGVKVPSELVKGYASGMQEVFAEGVVRMCQASDAGKQFICTPEVYQFLSNPSTWPTLAGYAKVAENSPEFFKLIEEMARTGTLPAAMQELCKAYPLVGTASVPEYVVVPAAYIVSSISAVSQQIGTNVANSIRGLWGWLADAAGEPGRHVAQALGHTVDAIGSIPGAKRVANNAQGLVDDIQGAKEMLTGAAAGIVERAKEVTGIVQPMPEGLRQNLASVQQFASELARAQAQEEAYRLSALALQEVQATWYGSTVMAVATSKFGANARSFYESVSPLFQNSLQALEALHKVSLANKDFLNAQIAAHVPVQQAVDAHMQALSVDAMKAMSVDERWVGGKGKEVLSTFMSLGGPAGELILGSYFLPVLIRRIAPHVLRSLAPQVGPNARPFFYSLAAASLDYADKTGKSTQEAVASLGGWFKRAYNAVTGEVDPARIDNFVNKLNLQEKTHLIDLAIHSKVASEQEKQSLKGFKARLETLTADEQYRVGQLTLQVFDRLDTAEKIKVSPSYFQECTKNVQGRVIEIVEQAVGLTDSERQDPAQIVAKFNALPDSERVKIDQMTIWEYGELSSDEQQDICFILAHSLKGKAHFSEKEQADMGLSELFKAFLVTEAEGDSAKVRHDVTRFRQIEKLSNKQMRALLPILSTLGVQERSMLTPSRLRDLGEAKILHCLEIVDRYRPDLMQVGSYNLLTLKKLITQPAGSSVAAQLARERAIDQLVVVLASAFQQLAPHQRAEIMQLTERQFADFSDEKKRQVLTFLLAEKGLEGNYSQLKDELVKLEMGGELDLEFIAATFNGLQVMRKAELLETLEIASNQKAKLEDGVKKEISNVQEGLKLVQKKLAKLHEKDFLGLQLRRDEAKLALSKLTETTPEKEALKKEIAACEKNLQATIEKVEKLQLYEKELHAELACLQRILGAAPTKFEDIEDAPLSPNRLATIQAAVGIATQCNMKTVIEAHIDPLKKFPGTGTSYDFWQLADGSEGHLKGMLKINEAKLEACKNAIKDMRTEINSGTLSSEQRIRKTLDIQTYKTFYLPLYEKMVQVNKESLQQFLIEVQAMLIRYPHLNRNFAV